MQNLRFLQNSHQMQQDNGGGHGDEVGRIRRGVPQLETLPEDCISSIISFTSPRDACRVASLSRVFMSAAQSDIVWERFLPPEYPSLIPPSLFNSQKKMIYLALCDNPVLIDGGKKSFWLEKWSGKKCYMLSARDLTIIWGGTPEYWRWLSLPEARFQEVAELISVCWVEIRGKMKTQMLSPKTQYTAYLVFKTTDRSYGLEFEPIEVGVGVVGSEACKNVVNLDVGRGRDHGRRVSPRRLRWWRSVRRGEGERGWPKERRDGWMEIELGEFFNKGGVDDEEEIEMSVSEIKGGHWKSGLIVQGIEIRPKEGDKVR